MTFSPRIMLGRYLNDTGGAGTLEVQRPQPGVMSQTGFRPIGAPLPLSAHTTVAQGGQGAFSLPNLGINVGGVAYVLARDGIYRYLPGPDTWSNAPIDGGAAFSSIPSGTFGSVRQSGLYFTILASGDPAICAVVNTATRNAYRIVVLNLASGVFTEGAITTIGVGQARSLSGIFFQGEIYIFSDNARAMAFDPNNPGGGGTRFTINAGAAPASDPFTWTPIVHNNRLFCSGPNNTGGLSFLFEFLGSSFSGFSFSLSQTGLFYNYSNVGVGNVLLFSDGLDLISFAPSNNGNGTINYATARPITVRVIEFADEAAAPTLGANVTDVVMPSGFRQGVAARSGPFGAGVWGFQEIDTSGNLQTYIVHHANTILTASSGPSDNNRQARPGACYRWNGRDQVMTYIGQVPSLGYGFPWGSMLAGGERIWRPDRPGLIYSNPTAAVGGETITYTPSGGQTGQIVEVLIDPNNRGQAATQLATIIGHTGGGIINANQTQVDGVDADGSPRTITIAASSTNFVTGDTGVNYMLRIRGS